MATTYQLLQLLPEARADGRPEVLRELLDEIGIDSIAIRLTHYTPRPHPIGRVSRWQVIDYLEMASGRWLHDHDLRYLPHTIPDSDLDGLYAERDTMMRNTYEALGISLPVAASPAD